MLYLSNQILIHVCGNNVVYFSHFMILSFILTCVCTLWSTTKHLYMYYNYVKCGKVFEAKNFVPSTNGVLHNYRVILTTLCR